MPSRDVCPRCHGLWLTGFGTGLCSSCFETLHTKDFQLPLPIPIDKETQIEFERRQGGLHSLRPEQAT